MTPHWTENSTRLKLLVGVMTTLLVIGLILLVVGIARTSKELSEQTKFSTSMFGNVPIKVKQGDNLIGLTSGNNRLYLGIRHKDGNQSILVLNSETGSKLGQLTLNPRP